ncbi:hypothetical protein PR048_008011 [Dryococelus australis]|uniref:Uncharacterized protein n=1 Tax=Dryococelus australis TaxID=614101 RepID=A0ABQ9HWT0_9NEOP|nr:hypothetical protein PR048_008011 [Dryococelus australis]
MHVIGTNEDEKKSGGSDNVAFMYGITENRETTNAEGIYSVRTQREKEWRQDVWVENKRINFKLDTGVAVNTIPNNIVAEMLPNVAFMPINITLEAFEGSVMKPKGVVNLICRVKGRNANLKFVVLNL